MSPLLTLLLLTATPAPAPMTAEALIARYDAIMSPAAFEATITMVATREDGTTRSYELRTQKEGFDKLRVTFLAPATAKGQEVLRVGENLWSFVPNLRRSVRVASRDSFMGGDFNNGDVLRVNYAVDYTGVLVAPDAPGQVCAELTAKSPSVAYDRIHLCLTDDAELLPVAAKYYAQSGKLLRSSLFSEVKEFGGHRRPSLIVMKNEVQTSRQSSMRWSAFEGKTSIPAHRFLLEDLGR